MQLFPGNRSKDILLINPANGESAQNNPEAQGIIKSKTNRFQYFYLEI